MQPDLIIRAGAVEFWGRMPPSRSGFVVEPDGLEGLDDGVAGKGEVVARPNEHGDFDLPVFLDSRIVSIAGNCLADSPQQLAWYGHALKGLFVEGSQRVVFDHLGEVTWAVARLAPSTTPKFKVNGSGATDAAFQIQLKFANPRLFGDARTFASGEPAFHYGNFPATPVHVVSGDMPGYTINGPDGKAKVVTVPVVPGHPHTIDDANGYLSIDGVIIIRGMTRADTWAIPAGMQVVQTLVPVSGTGALATTVMDTFL